MQARTERFTRPELEGVTLHLLHWGEPASPALVLLHGFGANAHWWDHLAPRLARRFHVTALDFRGHGDSDFPEALVPGAFQDDLAALLAHLGAPDAILVGHSLGAHVALSHATGLEAATRALVLIDPARGVPAARRRATRLALRLGRSHRSRAQAVARFRFLPGGSTASETLRLAIAHHSVVARGEGRYAFKFDPRWLGVASRRPMDPSRLRCPTLLLRGAESPLLSEHAAQSFAAELPGCRLATVEGAGHHPQLDRPDETLCRVESFLAALAPPDRSEGQASGPRPKGTRPG